MGNCQSSTKEWTFVGRDEELKKVKKLLFGEKSKRSILVFGMNKIGKTRFLEELYGQLSKKHYCLFKDFKNDNLKSGHEIYKWFIKFLTSIDAHEEIKRFENQYPLQTIACNVCKECQQSNGEKCSNRDDPMDTAVNSLIDIIREIKSEILLFLDNIDSIMDSKMKNSFLLFHRDSLKCPKLQTILASANRPKQTSRAFESCELKPLDNEAILKLLFETTELRGEENCDYTVTYSPGSLVFEEENEPYIETIVGLCEGLPLAAVMSGMLLTEDDGLLTPADLVEILIRMRLTCFSPENCPPDDRLDIYKTQMEVVKDGVKQFFNCLNKNMTGTVFSVKQAVAAASDSSGDIETEAMVKLNILKQALDRSIVSTQSKSGKHQMNWHGILRECQADLKALDSIPSDNDSAKASKEMVMKFMKENVVKAGLDFDEEILSNPRSLEIAIKSLSCRENTPPPIQVVDDDEEERMSPLEEPFDSKNVGTSKFDTEESLVMKTLKEVEHNKDLENSPLNDYRGNKKLATRYSASEGSDSSDSDSVNLQFTNIDLSQTEGPNGINGITNEHSSRNPPPYTSKPGPWEATASRHNQNDGNRNHFPTVGEPPPDYTSIDPNCSAQGNIPVASRQYASNAVIRNSESGNQYDFRSRSLPSVSSTSYNLQEQQHNTGENSYPVNNDSRNLHRAESDPTFNRPINTEVEQLVDSPRREIYTSGSDSLRGPPAMEYIPSEIQLEGSYHNSQTDMHFAIQNPHIHSTTGTRWQAQSHQLSEQKEPIPIIQEENVSVKSGFLTLI